MPEQVAPEGGQTTTVTEAPSAAPPVGQPQPVVTGSSTPTLAPTPPAAAGAPTGPPATPEADRDAAKFTQRDLDHIITQRLHEERQKVGKEFEDYKAEVAPELAEAKRLREDREAAAQATLTIEQKLQADLAERDRLLLEAQGEVAKRDAVIHEVGRVRRREQIDSAINAVSPAMLAVQREHIHRQFEGVEDLDPEQVTQAAQAAQAEVQAMLKTAGVIVPGTQIGSPGTPPAEPTPSPDTELEDLLTRAESGDDQAAAALQQRLRTR